MSVLKTDGELEIEARHFADLYTAGNLLEARRLAFREKRNNNNKIEYRRYIESMAWTLDRLLRSEAEARERASKKCR